MALSTTQYGYIIDPMVPFTDGKGNTIKEANQDLIELDNSGRTKTSVIGSKGLTYKVCVYDQLHSQESPILTVDKVSVIGANITAGAGATVVTGLDGLTTKPDGFVDASVVGTDGYVALDHTLVTDDLDTDAKATAVENDRYVPLLNDDVNDPDSKITLKRLKQWIHNDNVVFAGTIYPTLQDAIADADNLSVGDIFETNGFHTSGDGGASRYLVSDTGTANGMDIVQLASGKLAVLQTGDWIIPEQLGYKQSYQRDDVVPYIQRAIASGCQHIHLRSSGNGAGYTWKSKLVVTSRGFKITGEGDWGYPNKFTYIVFRPTDVSVNAMIDMKARDVVLKDLDIEVTGDYVKSVDGITNTGYDSDENRFWEIDNVRFNSFDNCIKFAGGIKWQNSIKNCLFNSCNIGLQIYESSTFELIVENCLFVNCEQYDVLVKGNLFAALFNSCGFGSQGTAICLTTNSDSYMYQNIKFEGCNFEQDDLAIQNAPALFIDCFPNPSHPYIRQNVTLSNCHLTLCKINYTVQDTTNRFFRLAPKTNLLLIANQILGKDEPDHPTWEAYPKLLWNENYLPTLGLGGIIECGNNLCGNGNFEYPDQLLPFVTRSTQARSILSTGAQSGTESAIADCNAFIPAHCGELIIGRGSTFENTDNMPTTSIFGFLYSVGVTEGPNKRVIQMMIASNSNIYTRIGRDIGSGWQFDPWKTITAA